MHIMRPFHRYCEISSTGIEAIENVIEDILCDLDCGIEIKPDDHGWPYTGEYLKRIFRKVQSGKRLDRFILLTSTVTVSGWSRDDNDDFGYTISTVRRPQ